MSGFQPRSVLLAYNQINPDLDRAEFPLYDPEDLIEYAGRWDYGPKSISKMGDRDIIGRWLNSGEESMVEMGDATFFIVCSRVVTHELVRHRLASFQQESQRFVRYDEEEPELLFYEPVMAEDAERGYWEQLDASLAAYQSLRNAGVGPQYARYVLPNATRTRIIVKANFREWRHILRLRCHTSAQPEMQEVMWQIHDELAGKFPAIFGDLKAKILAERANR